MLSRMYCYKNLKTKQLRFHEKIDGINISEENKIFAMPSLGTYQTAQNYAFPLAIAYSGEGIIKMV